LTESIDTETAGGRLLFHILGALAEFDKALIAERTKAGLAAAKRRGVKVGRKRELTAAQVGHARILIAAGERIGPVAGSLGVTRGPSTGPSHAFPSPPEFPRSPAVCHTATLRSSETLAVCCHALARGPAVRGPASKGGGGSTPTLLLDMVSATSRYSAHYDWRH
jgi:Resolvase, N terminal domain